MFKIAVCDDNKEICLQIKSILLEMKKKDSLEICVEVFVSGEELNKKLEKGHNFDLIFLDIEFKSSNGISIGKTIRDVIKNEIVQIVYISGNSTYAMELFDIRPLNFLIKPLDKKKIIEMCKKAISLGKIKKYDVNFFEFNINQCKYKINIDDIIYFESKGRKIKIFMRNDFKEFYGKLKEINSKLKDKGFYLIHNAYIVNFLHVKKQQYESLELSNGHELPISRKNRKKMRDVLIKHMNKGD